VVDARVAGKTELAGALLTYAMLTEGRRQQFAKRFSLELRVINF